VTQMHVPNDMLDKGHKKYLHGLSGDWKFRTARNKRCRNMGLNGIGYEAQNWIELVQSRTLVGYDKK